MADVVSTTQNSVVSVRALSLEEILSELSRYGKPRLGLYGIGQMSWVCVIEMITHGEGICFEVKSDMCRHQSPFAAAADCLARVKKTIELSGGAV
jgi:hypothetical protein